MPVAYTPADASRGGNSTERVGERRQLTEENPALLPMSGLGPRRQRPSRGLSYTPTVSELSAGRTAIALASAAEGGLPLDPLGFGVDVSEADFDVLRPIRHQPPPQQVQAALAGLGVVADHRNGVGWRGVPSRREVRSGFDPELHGLPLCIPSGVLGKVEE